MKQISSFSILLITFAILFLISALGAASFPSEVGEISYQINDSDHIVIGTVNGIDMYRDHSIVIIEVNEWLYNPLLAKTIKVRTEIGTDMGTANEAVFTQNESILLMLNDIDLNQKLFRVAIGGPGKHPISDRSAVIVELKAQGKWKGEEQAANKTNEAETIKNAETPGNKKENITESRTANPEKTQITEAANKQEGESNSTQKPNSTPFMSSFWVLVVVFGVIMYVKR